MDMQHSGQFDEFEPDIDAVGGMPCARAVKPELLQQFGSNAEQEGDLVVEAWSAIARRVMNDNDRSPLMTANGTWTITPSPRDSNGLILTVAGRDTEPTMYSTEWTVVSSGPDELFAYVVGFWIGGADQRS